MDIRGINTTRKSILSRLAAEGMNAVFDDNNKEEHDIMRELADDGRVDIAGSGFGDNGGKYRARITISGHEMLNELIKAGI